MAVFNNARVDCRAHGRLTLGPTRSADFSWVPYLVGSDATDAPWLEWRAFFKLHIAELHGPPDAARPRAQLWSRR